MTEVRSNTPLPNSAQSAFAFVQALAAELSGGTVRLPSYPEAALRAHRALADPKCSISRIADIVSSEPALAARLVGMANSAAYHNEQPVVDVQSAIIRLGCNSVRSAAMAFAVGQLREAAELRPVKDSLQRLWEQSLQMAAVCFVLAKRTPVVPDEAFLAGLLHAIGHMYMLARAAHRIDFLGAPADFEEIVHGWHPAIGKAILQNWALPERVSEAVGDQDDVERKHYGEPDLTDIVAGSKLLLVDNGTPLQNTSAQVLRRLKLSSDEVTALMQSARERVASLRASLG